MSKAPKLCPSDNLLLGTTSDRPFFKCDALETDWLAEDAVSGEPVSRRRGN